MLFPVRFLAAGGAVECGGTGCAVFEGGGGVFELVTVSAGASGLLWGFHSVFLVVGVVVVVGVDVR